MFNFIKTNMKVEIKEYIFNCLKAETGYYLFYLLKTY